MHTRLKMNRFTGTVSVVALGIAMAWAQVPAAGSQSTAGQPATAQTTNGQTSGTQTATAQKNASSAAENTSVTGCMTQRFGIFTVNDTATSKSWRVKVPGTSLYNDANHMVTVKGFEDPKAPTPTLYAQNVQTTGQPCGNAQANNGTQPGAATTGPTGATANGTPPNPSGAVAGSAESQSGTTGTNATTNTTGATPATGTSESNGATASQSGTGSTAAGPGTSPTTQPSENKGVPNSGTPTNTPPQSSPQK
jgi:hypothetical protein